MIPRPENGHLLSLWDSLDAAIKIEGLAFSNAYAKPSEQCIRAYNNARDGRYAAEKAYLDALERHKVLVPMNEAKIFGSKGYRLMLPELQALGEKIAEDSSDDPDVRARIKTTTIAKVVAIIRKAQGAFADAA